MRARPLAVYALLLALATGAGGAAEPDARPGFSIRREAGYKVLTVERPWPGAGRTFTYVLHRRGSPRPAGVRADLFVETPVRRVAALSTTYLPQIAAIGEAASVVGVDAAALVNSPEIRARVASGAAREVSRNGSPNLELLVALEPDLILAYGVGDEWDQHPKLAEAGLPVVVSGEWNEGDPLARAAWIEFVAAFYDKEDLARALWDSAAAEYRRLRTLASAAARRPAVLVNGPFQGSWSVSGGDSYMARFIADAGGAYLWRGEGGTGALTLSIEAVYARALGAEVWLNPGLRARRLADLNELDPRFAALPVVRRGEVWNNNLRLNEAGGNDYFESAVMNPQEVLADLIAILHPELLPGRRLVYYRKLEP